jgi:hypothetical protein
MAWSQNDKVVTRRAPDNFYLMIVLLKIIQKKYSRLPTDHSHTKQSQQKSNLVFHRLFSSLPKGMSTLIEDWGIMVHISRQIKSTSHLREHNRMEKVNKLNKHNRWLLWCRTAEKSPGNINVNIMGKVKELQSINMEKNFLSMKSMLSKNLKMQLKKGFLLNDKLVCTKFKWKNIS